MTRSTSSNSSANAEAPARPSLTLTPEQGAQRLLELIRGARSLREFTADRVEQAMGVKVGSVDGEGTEASYAYSERIDAHWLQSFDFSSKYRRFRYSFDPIEADAEPDMKAVCVDFDRFSAQLEAMGFRRQASRGEHGRLLHYAFDRMRDGVAEMRVHVTPQGERVWDRESGSARVCVRTVYVY